MVNYCKPSCVTGLSLLLQSYYIYFLLEWDNFNKCYFTMSSNTTVTSLFNYNHLNWGYSENLK